ncbi:PRCC_Cterm [Nesidiocoris tenuis]|uniref:PRCC_Cterm n=1 Tax=Nesidiocoris tenuis TaxID=355587 RepID=A0ABN7ACH9_9HEMI|nr:PRCC_Cterm [Nesidiocoris tenuis]
MNALVAYDDSDAGSDSEEESPSLKEAVVSTQKPKEADTSSIKKPEERKTIPLPSRQITNVNFDLNVLDKKRSQPIRITIPSLKDFEDEEPVVKPKLKPSTKGCGLFSLLPEPKNVTKSISAALVPQSISRVKTKTHLKKSSSVATKQKKAPEIVATDAPDDDDVDPVSSFFFTEHDDSAPLPDLPPITSLVDVHDNNQLTQITNEVPVPDHGYDGGNQSTSLYIGPSPIGNELKTHEVTSDDTTQLDDNALLRLCGARERKKKGQQMPELIDIDTNLIVGDSALMMTKELTKEQPSHGHKRKSECSSVQRRKHQITYLAEQAKAQELELRNNWAQNRMTKKQTQAKYGF